MKNIMKIVWLSVSLYLSTQISQYLTQDVITNLVNKLFDIIPLPILIDIHSYLTPLYNNIFNIVFYSMLFLGLDLICIDRYNMVKKVITLLGNLIIYVLGFSIFFILLQ